MEQNKKSVSPFCNENRNAYVIEHLTDSLLTLLQKKTLGEISISELCETAGVGRTSFYRNFETKEDILRRHIETLFQDWMNEWKNHAKLPIDQSVLHVFSHLEANRALYGLLYERGLTYLLKDILLDLWGFDPEQEVVAAYSSAYVAFFLYGWIEVWLRRGMKETAAELAGYLREAGTSPRQKLKSHHYDAEHHQHDARRPI